MILITLLAALLQTGGSITGVVRSQGTLDPIARASVVVPALGISTATDVNGLFRVDSLPAGRWQVEARALGYATHVLTVTSTGSGSLNLDFELAVRPLRLGGVSVSTSRATTGIAASALDPAGPPPIRISSAGELKYIPGVAEPDVLRALQVLPSVAAISDYSSALYVRGGASDQNVVLLDGVPIFNPYHLGGLFSAINADAVGSVDVWTGALPASQTDGLAAAVQVQPRSSARERLRTHGNIGLISSQLTIDAPLFDKRGAYLISARKTYLDAISHAAYGLGLLDVALPYGFSDVLGRLEYDLGKLGALTWSGYLNHEGIGTPERMAREINNDLDFDWGSRVSSLSVRHPLGGSAFAQARFGYSDFNGSFIGLGWDPPFHCEPTPVCWGPGGPPPPSPVDTTQFLTGNFFTRLLTTDFDLTWYRNAHQLRAGINWSGVKVRHFADFEEDDSDLLSDFEWQDRGRTFAVYLEDEWNVHERLHVRAGARMLDGGALGRAWLPRLGARLRLDRGWALSLGAGRYAQALRGMRDDESVVSSFVAYELLGLQPRAVGLARAEDIVLGVDWNDASTALRVDAYAKRMSNLVLPPAAVDPLDTPALILDEYRVGSGSAHGLEVMARWRQGNFDVGFNYSYAQALRKVGAEEFVPRFERRHTLDLTTSYASSRSTLISARLALGSGQPYTPATGVLPGFFYDGGDGFYDWGTVVVLGEHNSRRLPGYLRLDIAARKSSRKRWFGRETTVTPYLQVLNVLNSKNVLITEPGRDPLTGKPRFSYWPQFPLLPTFGLEWTF